MNIPSCTLELIKKHVNTLAPGIAAQKEYLHMCMIEKVKLSGNTIVSEGVSYSYALREDDTATKNIFDTINPYLPQITLKKFRELLATCKEAGRNLVVMRLLCEKAGELFTTIGLYPIQRMS